MEARKNKIIGLFLAFALVLVSPSDASPAAKLKPSRGSAEREDDGAYSPRDKSHFSEGVHNSEFDHESILGSHKAADEFDHLPPHVAKERLAILLGKMDLNKDRLITRLELKSWVLRSYRMLSEEESSDRFDDTDENEDNKLTWEEYLSDTFGVSANDIQIDSQDNELIQEDKKMFEMADKDKDGFLTRKEFILFTHPEEYPEMFPLILEQTLKDKDKNNDGYIDFQEYMGEKAKDQNKEWLISEKTKFDTDFDKDHDGRLNSVEILAWMVPSNDDIAFEEADHLIRECDIDGDGMLSFEEALDQHEVFVGSEATDYGDHLHNIHAFQDEL